MPTKITPAYFSKNILGENKIEPSYSIQDPFDALKVIAKNIMLKNIKI